MKNVKDYWLIGLMMVGLIIAIPGITHATPGANVLITDNPDNRVIEVDPNTGNVVWQYGGDGTLNYPNEAIPLTNGNIMIADTYNNRVIEIDSATQQIVWQYPANYTTTFFRPVDIKRCVSYLTGTPTETLLITDIGSNRVMEITYPGGHLVWQLNTIDIGVTGQYLFWEAEKRPGRGTPTYLITSRSHAENGNCVMIVQRTSQNTNNITWQYFGPTNAPLRDPRDANWTPCDKVLITDPDSQRVIEVEPKGINEGTIVWQYGPSGQYIPLEAIRIENMNTLIAGVAPPNPNTWDDNKDGRYPPYPQGGGNNDTDVREVLQGTNIIVWNYLGYGTESAFVDVEEKGIINIAKIKYQDMHGKPMKDTFAGVIVPIYQPEIIGPPWIVATKTVSPTGPQQPGATLTYTIVCKNSGVSAARKIRIIDQIPEGTVYITDSATSPCQYSHDGGITYDSLQTVPVTHIQWTIDNLEPGASVQVQFSVRIR